jgi:hypothetical protein
VDVGLGIQRRGAECAEAAQRGTGRRERGPTGQAVIGCTVGAAGLAVWRLRGDAEGDGCEVVLGRPCRAWLDWWAFVDQGSLRSPFAGYQVAPAGLRG